MESADVSTTGEASLVLHLSGDETCGIHVVCTRKLLQSPMQLEKMARSGLCVSACDALLYFAFLSGQCSLAGTVPGEGSSVSLVMSFVSYS